MPVVSQIQVNTAQMDSDIRRLRGTLAQTRAHIETLRAKMAAMNNMWEGPSNLAMRQRFQADHDQMLALCGSLEELIQILESIRQAYDACENNVRSMVDALRI